jgi:aspartyl-tRNA(Asn)/glutamyl-tRNA(Gln) amidotransferase subunit B
LLDDATAVSGSHTDQVATVVDLGLDGLVVAAVAAGVTSGLALARTANEAATDADAARALDPDAYVALLSMEASGALTATQAKTLLVELLANGGGDPEAMAAARGFEAMSEDSLSATVAEVIAASPAEWDRYRNGDDTDRKKLGGFFTGKVMKATKGQANGKAVAEELERLRG